MSAVELSGLSDASMARLLAGRHRLGPYRAHLDRRGFAGQRLRVLILDSLFVDVDGGHLGGEFGRVGSPVTVLPEDGNDKLRISAGNDADEPSVGQEFL